MDNLHAQKISTLCPVTTLPQQELVFLFVFFSNFSTLLMSSPTFGCYLSQLLSWSWAMSFSIFIFSPCPVEEGEWESGWVGFCQLANINPSCYCFYFYLYCFYFKLFPPFGWAIGSQNLLYVFSHLPLDILYLWARSKIEKRSFCPKIIGILDFCLFNFLTSIKITLDIANHFPGHIISLL